MSLPPEKRVLALRIAARLRDMPRHRAALEVAMGGFGPGFDHDRFVATAASDDPEQLVRAYPIQSGFENIQNHITGLTRDALELVGALATDERPNAPRDLRRLQRLGAISRARCDRIIVLQELRSSLQHTYADTGPEELHAAVVGLVAEFDGFLADYRHWLRSTLSTLDGL